MNLRDENLTKSQPIPYNFIFLSQLTLVFKPLAPQFSESQVPTPSPTEHLQAERARPFCWQQGHPLNSVVDLLQVPLQEWGATLTARTNTGPLKNINI